MVFPDLVAASPTLAFAFVQVFYKSDAKTRGTLRPHMILCIFMIALMQSPESQAGAWLSPKGHAEITIKSTNKKDISDNEFKTPTTTQREIFGQFGITDNWSLTINRLTRSTPDFGAYGAGQKFEAMFLTGNTLLNPGLLLPFTFKLIKKISPLPVSRSTSATIGLGYTMLREFPNANHTDYGSLAISYGDKITLGQTSFLGQVTYANLFNDKIAISDMRALLQIERSQVVLGYEYGVYIPRDQNIITEDLVFIDLPLSRAPLSARIRFTRSRKTERLYDINHKLTGVWLRIPFSL